MGGGFAWTFLLLLIRIWDNLHFFNCFIFRMINWKLPALPKDKIQPTEYDPVGWHLERSMQEVIISLRAVNRASLHFPLLLCGE